jgi:hypothetical protein
MLGLCNVFATRIAMGEFDRHPQATSIFDMKIYLYSRSQIRISAARRVGRIRDDVPVNKRHRDDSVLGSALQR